jgi:hypothetical protein
MVGAMSETVKELVERLEGLMASSKVNYQDLAKFSIEMTDAAPRLFAALRAAIAWLESEDHYQVHRGSDVAFRNKLLWREDFRKSLGAPP